MGRSTMLLLGLGLLLLLGAIAFALSLSRSGPGSDRLEGAGGEGSEKSAATDPEARCAAPATYDRLKRELFRQAATTRGADLAAFDRLSAYAAIRVTDPVLREQDEGLEQVTCSGNVALDLPPGVQVVGGRRTLSANLQYSLQPAADGSGDVLTLRGAEPIVVPLATLARVGTPSAPAAAQPGSEPVPEPAIPPQAPGQADTPPPPQAPPEPTREAPTPPRQVAPPPAPPATTAARPSFNCANARTRGERAVCGSGELAALDRQMASRFFAARREANTTQRVLLDRTRGRFLAFRDRCTSDSCVADAYRDRIREISDIMADRWVAPR